MERRPLKTVAIGRTQSFTGDPYREVYHAFCYFVGGVLSPLLANVYLHELDKFVEHELIPAFTAGDKRRKTNPAYNRLEWQWMKARAAGDRKRARVLDVQRKKLPFKDPQDPTYRRLRYVRYADDVRRS